MDESKFESGTDTDTDTDSDSDTETLAVGADPVHRPF